MARAEAGAQRGEQRGLVEYAFVTAETCGDRAQLGNVQAAHEVVQRGGVAVELGGSAVECKSLARWVGCTACRRA